MDIEKWRVLLSALDCGSLAAAAQCNNYTTSGISRIIASLESEVGFKLLIRSRKGVKPTKECGLLLSEVRSLINSDETLSQKILRIKGFDTGTLTIGTSYSSSYGLLSDTVARFVKQYPNIKVSILWGYKSQLRQSVLSREIDIAVTTNQGEGSDKLLWLPLRKTRMVALVPSTHRMARRSSFPIDDFTKYPKAQHEIHDIRQHGGPLPCPGRARYDRADRDAGAQRARAHHSAAHLSAPGHRDGTLLPA